MSLVVQLSDCTSRCPAVTLLLCQRFGGGWAMALSCQGWFLIACVSSVVKLPCHSLPLPLQHSAVLVQVETLASLWMVLTSTQEVVAASQDLDTSR